jgi:alkaline phosphatase D
MVDFFMLDGRYYRTPTSATMLGPVQKQWLKDQLSQSTGAFKVIVSPVPWHDAAKNSNDTWRGFQAERTEIFHYIRDNNITGVISLTADRHRADALINPITDYYGLYEFENSRMTNSHSHGTISNSDWLFSYNGDRMFGIVTFDLTKDDPTVTYNVVRASNNEILSAPYEVTVKGSQLNVPSFNMADFDDDGIVDANDITIMAEEFLDSGIRPSN